MEKAHDISLDEPCVAHQAILFMLDVLMRNNKPTLDLAQLYDSFGDKSFTPQMLRAVGGNEQGLKQFLLRYPSLFTVNGDAISANSGGSQLPRNSTTPERYLRKTKSKQETATDGITPNSASPNSSGDLINSSSSSSSSTSSSTSANNPGAGAGASTVGGILSADTPAFDSKTMKEIEQEAIAFFRKQISKREEDWLPIVSVAGHASQSSSDVRKFVGPQNEFKNFLVKYPNIFIVRDEFCGLKGRADISTQPFPPPSPPPKRRLTTNVTLISTNGLPAGVATIGSNSLLARNHSFKATNRYSACGNMMPNSTLNLVNANTLMQSASLASQVAAIQNSNSINSASMMSGVGGGGGSINPTTGMSKPRLTPVEVKAVHYVMRILHKNGRMLLQTIPGLISRAPDQVSNIVGFTREDLIQFFKRHSAIFQLHPDGCVSVKQDAVKALILKDNLNGSVGSGNGSPSNTPNDFNSAGAIITSNGVILRIFPKYGILNMENNEQVFFDIQSCQFETFSDLTTILHTGDRLYFNAIIGPRDGSTKWRSLKTWIKMRPQPNSSGGSNNMICTLDNMSCHSDADKSDDSSTSSHGGGTGNSSGFGSSSLRRQNNRLNGNFYPLSSASSGQQTSNQQQSAFSASSPVANSSQNQMNGSGMLQSNSNLSLDNEANNTNNNNESQNHQNGGTSGVHASLSGDFNLYQLDNGDSGANSATGGTIDENSELLISSTHSSSNQLIHSTSANNLQTMLQNQIAEAHAKASAAATNAACSKSVHSFNSLTPPNEHSLEDLHLDSLKPPSSTKFMKQSADNISERETSQVNPKMVSMACQTFSTGDITVSNVYIE